MKNKAFKPSYKRFMLLSVLASAWVFFTNVHAHRPALTAWMPYNRTER